MGPGIDISSQLRAGRIDGVADVAMEGGAEVKGKAVLVEEGVRGLDDGAEGPVKVFTEGEEDRAVLSVCPPGMDGVALEEDGPLGGRPLEKMFASS